MLDKLIAEYTDMFGGFPYYETAGIPENLLIPKICAALKTKKEMNFDYEDRVY